MQPKGISRSNWLRYNYFFILEHCLGQKLFSHLIGSFYNRFLEDVSLQVKNDRNVLNDSAPKLEEFSIPPVGAPIVNNTSVQVYRGLAKDWPCVANWDLSFFEEKFGNKEVTILNSEGLFEKGTQELGITTLSKYIEELRRGSKTYLKFSPVIQHSSELRADFDEEWLEKFSLPGSFGRKYFLFIGPDKSQTPIHTGLSNTVFVQVYGKKKWTFWEPNERFFLGVKPERMQYFYSQLNPQDLNEKEFPLGQYARKFEVVLNEGDVLWFPGFFWHHVENIGNSIGVAYKTAHLPSAFKNSKKLTTLFFLATRPSLLESLLKTGFKNNERIFLN